MQAAKNLFLSILLLSSLPNTPIGAQVSPTPLAQFPFKCLSKNTTGIDFINKEDNSNSSSSSTPMLAYCFNGAGVGVADFNNDGLQDIYFVSNTGSNKLYLNQGNLHFLDITQSAGVSGLETGPTWKTGVTIADINGDGLLDIYICCAGNGEAANRKNKAFINNGNLTFTDRATEMGLAEKGYSTQAVFFDYDHDGDLDCLVIQHNIKEVRSIENAAWRKKRNPNTGNKLFRNDVDPNKNKIPHFTDVSIQAGIQGSVFNFSLGVVVADINNDGWQDIYITNDFNEPDVCYINQQNGYFAERANALFDHQSKFSTGLDIADINNDGLMDIFTADMLPITLHDQKMRQWNTNYDFFRRLDQSGRGKQYMRNMLQLNNGDNTFSEIGQLAGISKTDRSWASLFADFDNDGNKDIFIASGFPYDFLNNDFLKFTGDSITKSTFVNQQKNRPPSNNFTDIPQLKTNNHLYHNNGDLTFTEQPITSNPIPSISNGAVYADLDNDGYLEIIVNNFNDTARIYHNINSLLEKVTSRPTANHYLDIKLIGQGKNTRAIGAKITLYTHHQKQTIEQSPTRGYLSSVSPILHFGIGKNTSVDSLIIHWPLGNTQTIKNPSIDKILTIKSISDVGFTDVLPNGSRISSAKYSDEIQTAVADKDSTSCLKLRFYSLFSIDNPKPVFSPAINTKGLPTPDAKIFLKKDTLFNDFKRQPLMPQMLSNTSPVIAVGDINQDGLEDLFIGASKGGDRGIFLQQKDGTWKQPVQTSAYNTFQKDRNKSDADAQFFDANGDGYPDLYIASGGYADYNQTGPQYNLPPLDLQDRLYLNDGKGNLSLSTNTFPAIPTTTYSRLTDRANMLVAKSCVRPTDIDNDGDQDLFVGGKHIPGRYPEILGSYILENDGKGKFRDITQKACPELQYIGMVTDAKWIDMNNDKLPDLIVVGHYMPIKIFINLGNKHWQDQSAKYFPNQQYGFWNCILAQDLDNDGDIDLLVGNIGDNSPLTASPENPIKLFYADFDGDGAIDPVMAISQEKYFTFAGKDELFEQMAYLKRKFINYNAYANASFDDLIPLPTRAGPGNLKITTTQTTLFENMEGKFQARALPIQAQFAPVQNILLEDFTGSGHKDLLLTGNARNMAVRYGNIDANKGVLLSGKPIAGKSSLNNYQYIPQVSSGLHLQGDIKSAKIINTTKGKTLILGSNGQGVILFTY
jgi:enediyne biosynthesis protein E4